MTPAELLAFVMVRRAWMSVAQRHPWPHKEGSAEFHRQINGELRLTKMHNPTVSEQTFIFQVCS